MTAHNSTVQKTTGAGQEKVYLAVRKSQICPFIIAGTLAISQSATDKVPPALKLEIFIQIKTQTDRLTGLHDYPDS